MNIIMVTVPLVLVLCILGLIYAIINTLQRKGAPKMSQLVICNHSVNDEREVLQSKKRGKGKRRKESLS
ncbi:hypothetical protein QQF64_029696 [Cirrhinus molitorella]|uniref:Peptidase M10A matrix metallopeptidase C-terminal domain-containing protein n=1 Tax=Cirrhinus molitorella TaxID=172907 RepID=A0ABR3N184_9TELE